MCTKCVGGKKIFQFHPHWQKLMKDQEDLKNMIVDNCFQINKVLANLNMVWDTAKLFKGLYG